MSDIVDDDPMARYRDPDDPGNGPEYLTGEVCVVTGCGKPAGTLWSPWWCQACNAERMQRIANRFKDALSEARAWPGGVADG